MERERESERALVVNGYRSRGNESSGVPAISAVRLWWSFQIPPLQHVTFLFFLFFFLSNRKLKSEREEQEEHKAEKITELQGMEPKQS